MGSLPPNTTEREYGRRLYVADLDYQGQIRKPTDKAFDDMYKLPHSENKKPYMEDSYEEMEYFQSPPFGFPWDFPDFDAPWQVPGEPIKPPWLLIFTCQVSGSPCWCNNFKKCYTINCSHNIVEAHINPLGDPGDVGEFNVTASTGEICITGGADADGVVRIDILMVADPGDGSQVYGEYGPILIAGCPNEECECGDPPAFSYNKSSSPETIYQTGSGTVYVAGGVSPYTWIIEGTGLTLDNAQTVGLTNSLNADATACGPGHMTITDACGQVAHGYIRVVEDGAWSGWGGTDEVLWEPCNFTWGANSGNVVCDDVIWFYYASWGGEGYRTADPCPQSCLCADHPISAITGPPDTTLWDVGGDHGCDHTCTEQPDTDSLKYCNIKVQEWGCA